MEAKNQHIDISIPSVKPPDRLEYYNLSTGELITRTTFYHDGRLICNISLWRDLHTKLKDLMDDVMTRYNPFIMVSAVDPEFVVLLKDINRAKLYNLELELIGEFQPDVNPKYVKTIAEKGHTAYSQYNHIGFLRSDGSVLIYRKDGKLLFRWHASIVNVTCEEDEWDSDMYSYGNPEYGVPYSLYKLIMLPNNFLGIIEILGLDEKKEGTMINLHIYTIDGKKYKIIRMCDIVGQPVNTKGGYGRDRYFQYMIYRKQLTIIYREMIYILPAF
jgi:hypothetical protein